MVKTECLVGWFSIAVFALGTACSSAPSEKKIAAKAAKPAESEQAKPGKIAKASFGKGSLGQAIDLYTMRNAKGTEVAVTNFGGIVTSIKTKDRAGKLDEITLGFDTLEGYFGTHPYFGALIGRYANRIANAAFELNGVTYKLAANNGPNHLHGGTKGFDKGVWEARAGMDTLELNYRSRDGEEGYPGNLSVRVVYSLSDEDVFRIDYTASTDRDTVVNLSNHAYFNLAGGGDVLGHELMINADKFTPVDDKLIPTGVLKPVKGTPFDFTKPAAIGARIEQKDEQLKFGGGYDHNYVLNGAAGTMRVAAEVYEPQTGRVLTVSTDQPGVQLYTGNFLDGSLKGHGGKVIPRRGALCLETQHFPDSPNKPAFPSTLLKPSAEFRSSTTWQFSTR